MRVAPGALPRRAAVLGSFEHPDENFVRLVNGAPRYTLAGRPRVRNYRAECKNVQHLSGGTILQPVLPGLFARQDILFAATRFSARRRIPG